MQENFILYNVVDRREQIGADGGEIRRGEVRLLGQVAFDIAEVPADKIELRFKPVPPARPC